MMARLIDADKLLTNTIAITNWKGQVTWSAVPTIDILAAPTVDAKEVVKCRECIGRSTWYNDTEYGCAICGMSGMYLKNEDDYCSYGLRKGSDGNG